MPRTYADASKRTRHARGGWLYLERPERLDVVRLLADRHDLASALDLAGDGT